MSSGSGPGVLVPIVIPPIVTGGTKTGPGPAQVQVTNEMSSMMPSTGSVWAQAPGDDVPPWAEATDRDDSAKPAAKRAALVARRGVK